MIYFNLINPFVLTPSLGFLVVWAIKSCLLYPIFFLGTFKHLQPRKIPFYFYLILAVGNLFLPFYFLLNDLIWIVITIMLTYLLADHGTGSLTDLVASFGYSMVVYYFAQTIVSGLVAIFGLVARPSNTAFFLLENAIIILCYGVALSIILASRKFFRRYMTRLRGGHPIAKWSLSLAFLPIAYFLYYTQFNRRLTLPPVLLGRATPLQAYLTYLAISVTFFLAVLVVMVTTSRYLANSDRAAFAEYRLANLTKYTSQLEVMTDDLRRFRHDYQNILYSLTSALETNNLDYAKRALSHFTSATQRDIKVPTGIMGPLKNIVDPGIKAVTFNKIAAAMDKGLTLEVEIDAPIQLTQTLEQLDAIRVITILFDNAIRAAAGSEKKLVNFSLYENQFAQFIIVGNSTAQEAVDLDQLATITHTVILGRNHHLGLRNLQIILARYPGASNNRSSKNHYFEQRIIIPKK